MLAPVVLGSPTTLTTVDFNRRGFDERFQLSAVLTRREHDEAGQVNDGSGHRLVASAPRLGEQLTEPSVARASTGGWSGYEGTRSRRADAFGGADAGIATTAHGPAASCWL